MSPQLPSKLAWRVVQVAAPMGGRPRPPPLLLQQNLLLTPRLELIMTQQLLLAITLHSRQVMRFDRLILEGVVTHAVRHFLKLM